MLPLHPTTGGCIWHCNSHASVFPRPSLTCFSLWYDLALHPSKVTESNPLQGLKLLHSNSNGKYLNLQPSWAQLVTFFLADYPHLRTIPTLAQVPEFHSHCSGTVTLFLYTRLQAGCPTWSTFVSNQASSSAQEKKAPLTWVYSLAPSPAALCYFI